MPVDLVFVGGYQSFWQVLIPLLADSTDVELNPTFVGRWVCLNVGYWYLAAATESVHG